MEVLTFYFPKGQQREVAIADWYCKPAILRNIACRFGLLFLTASKYGCRQFTPHWSPSYPVHNIEFRDYKENLPWMVIEFNSFAKSGFDSYLIDLLEDCYV